MSQYADSTTPDARRELGPLMTAILGKPLCEQDRRNAARLGQGL